MGMGTGKSYFHNIIPEGGMLPREKKQLFRSQIYGRIAWSKTN
jgi:hypothetical protein